MLSHTWQEAGEGPEAMLSVVALEATVVAAMATMPAVEAGTGATTAAMVALPEATMAMVAMEAEPLVVSLFPAHPVESYCCMMYELTTWTLLSVHSCPNLR